MHQTTLTTDKEGFNCGLCNRPINKVLYKWLYWDALEELNVCKQCYDNLTDKMKGGIRDVCKKNE